MILKFASNTILEIIESSGHELQVTRHICTQHVEGFQGKKWVRTASICALFNDRFLPVGMIKILQDHALTDEQYTVKLINSELWKTEKNLTLPEFEKALDSFNLPMEPYDYQFRFALYPILFGRAFCAGATSSGKTFISYLSIGFALKHKSIRKAVVVVPSVILVEQFANDYIEFNENSDFKIKPFKIHSSARNEFEYDDCNVVISTFQSMTTWSAEAMLQFDYLFLDEAHTAGSMSVINIIKNCRHIKYVFGMTGTVPGDKLLKQTMYSYIGYHFETYTSEQLIADGRAAPIRIIPVVIQNRQSVIDKLHRSLLEPVNINNPESEPVLETKSKVLSIEQLLTIEDDNRNIELFKIITAFKQNFLVLSKRVKVLLVFGEKLQQYCNDNNLNKTVHIIAGRVNKSVAERDRIIDILNTNPDDNILLGNMDILSTGVSVKALFNAMFLNIGKSDTKTIQAVGRLMRLHLLKTGICTILDVSDSFKTVNKIDSRMFRYNKVNSYLVRHQLTRLQHYKDNAYPVAQTLMLTIQD